MRTQRRFVNFLIVPFSTRSKRVYVLTWGLALFTPIIASGKGIIIIIIFIQIPTSPSVFIQIISDQFSIYSMEICFIFAAMVIQETIFASTFCSILN